MYQLYYSPGACSMAAHVILNEIGAPMEAIKVDLHAGEGQKPEFLKINPRGQVPVLVDNGKVIRECAAIMIYLMETNNSPLLPKTGEARTRALEWLMFANATLHPAYSRGFGLMRVDIDKAAKDTLTKITVEQINKLWKEVDETLEKSKYIAGDSITAADILLTVIANWSGNFTGITFGANVKRLLKEISARPSYQKALKDEQVEYKAAA
jgi:glutathione S-transferase